MEDFCGCCNYMNGKNGNFSCIIYKEVLQSGQENAIMGYIKCDECKKDKDGIRYAWHIRGLI
jgi:hypothetical protein